jgi:antitoxin HicB
MCSSAQETTMKVIDDALEAQVQAILGRPYHRVITGEPVEGYLGEVPELPGCVTAGETPEEALSSLEEAMAVWIESALVHGDPIPEPAAGPVRLSA